MGNGQDPYPRLSCLRTIRARKRFCGTAGVPPARVPRAQLSEVDINVCGRDARGTRRALAWFYLDAVKSDPKLIVNRRKVRSSV